MRTADNQQQ